MVGYLACTGVTAVGCKKTRFFGDPLGHYQLLAAGGVVSVPQVARTIEKPPEGVK